jgi:RNA-directed DNA polymerase
MPRRETEIFDEFTNFGALRAAAKRAVRGKRRKPGASAFFANLETEILRLERELREGRYRPGAYMMIRVSDPKERIVSAAPFRDRVVHHAVCATIQPIFERGFIANSFASRPARARTGLSRRMNAIAIDIDSCCVATSSDISPQSTIGS